MSQVFHHQHERVWAGLSEQVEDRVRVQVLEQVEDQVRVQVTEQAYRVLASQERHATR